jgi:hypothetical protein
MVPALGPAALLLGVMLVFLASWWVWVPLLAAGLALSVLLARRIGEHVSQRGRRVYQFTGGLVVDDKALRPEAVAWDDIERFSHGQLEIRQQALPGTRGTSMGTHTFYAIRCTDGRTLEIGNEFKHTGPIAATLEREVRPRQLTRAMARLTAGEEIDLGAVRVRPDSIAVYRDAEPYHSLVTPPRTPVLDRTIRWAEIERLDYAGGLRVHLTDRSAPVVTVDYRTVWDPVFMVNLLERIRSKSG